MTYSFPKLKISEEVLKGLENGKPVVALESTIISHGMPYPKNVECALALEEIVRKEGCVPATIAIIDGIIHVGLSKDEIEYIGSGENEVIKVSRRDIPIITAKGLNGATTVSATMYIASKVGIKVFGTGGIGGVHRCQDEAMDISADLDEFAKTNCIVVSAGCKSILDIPNTLEYLETKGVPVLGYKTLECPAFYTKDSGIKLEYMVEDPIEVAKIAYDKWSFGLDGGILVANPIKDEYSYKKEEIDKIIDNALKLAKENNITGKRITPFLLKTIVKETNGESLKANIQLVKSNVELAAKIALKLSEYEKRRLY